MTISDSENIDLIRRLRRMERDQSAAAGGGGGGEDARLGRAVADLLSALGDDPDFGPGTARPRG